MDQAVGVLGSPIQRLQGLSRCDQVYVAEINPPINKVRYQQRSLALRFRESHKAMHVVDPPEYDVDRYGLTDSEIQTVLVFSRRLIALDLVREVMSRMDDGGRRWIEITGPRELAIRKAAGLYAALIGGGRTVIAARNLAEVLSRAERLLVRSVLA